MGIAGHGRVMQAFRSMTLHFWNVNVCITKLRLLQVLALLVQVLSLLITRDLRTNRWCEDSTIIFDNLLSLLMAAIFALIQRLPLLLIAAFLHVHIRWSLILASTLIQLIDERDLSTRRRISCSLTCALIRRTLLITVELIRRCMRFEFLKIGTAHGDLCRLSRWQLVWIIVIWLITYYALHFAFEIRYFVRTVRQKRSRRHANRYRKLVKIVGLLDSLAPWYASDFHFVPASRAALLIWAHHCAIMLAAHVLLALIGARLLAVDCDVATLRRVVLETRFLFESTWFVIQSWSLLGYVWHKHVLPHVEDVAPALLAFVDGVRYSR